MLLNEHVAKLMQISSKEIQKVFKCDILASFILFIYFCLVFVEVDRAKNRGEGVDIDKIGW